MGLRGARTQNILMLGSGFLEKGKKMKEMGENGEGSTLKAKELI